MSPGLVLLALAPAVSVGALWGALSLVSRLRAGRLGRRRVGPAWHKPTGLRRGGPGGCRHRVAVGSLDAPGRGSFPLLCYLSAGHAGPHRAYEPSQPGRGPEPWILAVGPVDLLGDPLEDLALLVRAERRPGADERSLAVGADSVQSRQETGQ